MPTYQYACTSCGERLEAVQKFSDDPLTECPTCQGHLRKVFSAVGVVFKGSGFYKTDSRKPAASSTGGTTTAAKDGATKDGATSDTGNTSTPAEKKTTSSDAATSSPSTAGSGQVA